MNKPLIVLDMDDTVANLRDQFALIINNHLQREDIRWEDWDNWHLDEKYDFDILELFRSYADSDLFLKLEPETGARNVFDAAQAKGFGIAVVTARGWHNQAEAHTWQWLRYHGLKADTVHVAPTGGCKSEPLSALGDVRLFVDDHPGHVKRALELSNIRQAMLINRPWNRAANLPRIGCLTEAAEMILRMDIEAA